MRPAVERLRHLFTYEPETGKIFRNFTPRGKPVKIEVNSKANPYVQLWVDGKNYAAHAIVWAIFYGKFSCKNIHYKNDNVLDLRIENLVEIGNESKTRLQRFKKTNSSGFKGVYWSAEKQSWVAAIGYMDGDRKRVKWLGAYADKQLASEAYLDAVDRFHEGIGRIVDLSGNETKVMPSDPSSPSC